MGHWTRSDDRIEPVGGRVSCPAGAGAAVLMVAHDLEAATNADWVLVLRDGASTPSRTDLMVAAEWQRGSGGAPESSTTRSW